MKIVGLFNNCSIFWGHLCIYKAYFNDFSCLRQHFILFKLTDVKMYQTKYLVYAFIEI